MCFSLKYLSGSIYFVQAEFLNNSWVKELMSLKKLTRQKFKNQTDKNRSVSTLLVVVSINNVSFLDLMALLNHLS